MAASEADDVEAGGRELRVTSPDRVIFPETERTGAVTKLDIVRYYLAVGDGIMRALARRPTTLERWPKGVHPGIVLSTREERGGDAFYQKRIPQGRARLRADRAHRVPLRAATPTRSARRRSRSSAGRRRWARSPSIRGRCATTTSTTPTSCGIDLDPQPGTDFADAVRVAAEARALLGELGYAGFPKTSGGRGVHIYVRIEPRWTFTDVRHAAIAFGRELERRLPGQVTTKWWKEERGERIFVDYNQNARDRTIASAYSIRPKPGAPVSAPVTWDELPDVAPEDFTVATMPARFAEVGDRHAAIDDVAHSLQPLLDLYERDEAGRHALSARLPEDAGRAQARAALARPRPRRASYGACGSFFAPRVATGADGGGTTGPMSPSGASSRSTITGAWSLGPVALAGLAVDPCRPHPLGDRPAGEHQVDPHPEVLVEHAGAVVPVGEHALVRPAVAHHVVQAERLQLAPAPRAPAA